MVKKRWAAILYQSIDGSSLKNSHRVTGQHQWVADGTSLFSGRNYINCHKVRIGALPTRSRMTRGRPEGTGDRLCRVGCMAQETNNHVLQIFPCAHKARIDRHDAVLSYLGRNLRRQGFEVQEEPHYRTQEGLRKPDIVATMGTLGLVIETQIVSEQSDLERVRTAKIRKYADNSDIELAIQRETRATNIRFTYRSSSPGGVSGAKCSVYMGAIKNVSNK